MTWTPAMRAANERRLAELRASAPERAARLARVAELARVTGRDDLKRLREIGRRP